MLFGEGTPSEEAGRLLSTAAEHGISFFDSAEMYPVPQRAATQGASEEVLGAWLRQRRRCAVWQRRLRYPAIVGAHADAKVQITWLAAAFQTSPALISQAVAELFEYLSGSGAGRTFVSPPR